MSGLASMFAGARRNPYLTTVSGREIDLVEPRVADVDFRDIAHHLAHNCRYSGACSRTYTVAEHLLRGLKHCTPEVAAYWLAHDAHEAFTQDDTTPKKRALPEVIHRSLLGGARDAQLYKTVMLQAFDEFERRHMECVHRAAGLEWPVPPAIEAAVKELDRRMLVTEWAALMPGSPPAGYDVEPLPDDRAFSLYSSHRWSFEELRDGLLMEFHRRFPGFALGAR